MPHSCEKKYDTDDNEYELNFEGIQGDVDVTKDSYSQMVEGDTYELHMAKYSKIVFLLKDPRTGTELTLD